MDVIGLVFIGGLGSILLMFMPEIVGSIVWDVVSFSFEKLADLIDTIRDLFK